MCSAGAMAPTPCTDLYSCSTRTELDNRRMIVGGGPAYGSNFTPLVIALAFWLLLAIISWLLNWLQQSAAKRTRAQRFSASHSATGGDAVAAVEGGESIVQVSDEASPPPPAGLAFSNVSVSVNGGRVKLLQGVSGTVAEGTVCGIMGQSGSGKSTLLDALRGRSIGSVAGVVRLGREPLKGSGGHRLSLVPKQDILDRALTPRELFALAARLHSLPDVHDAVARMLRLLGLEAVADTVLAGSETAPANVSGGQLKRVSIGVELIGDPLVLLLDEPTSGLDSTASNDLLANLRAIARSRRVTILSVIHQPRAELWQRLDSVLLLAGGEVVYSGPPAAFLPFAARVTGLSLSADSGNPADVALDIATGRLRSGGGGAGSKSADSAAAASAVSQLASAWRSSEECRRVDSFVAASLAATATAAPPPPQRLPTGETVGSTAPHLTAPTTTPPPFSYQIYLQASRALLVRLRQWPLLVLYFALHIGLSAALSSGFSSLIQKDGYTAKYSGQYNPPVTESLQAYCPSFLGRRCEEDVSNQGLRQMMFFVSPACGIGSGIAGVQLFAGTLGFTKREGDAGSSPLAAGIGRMLADLPIVFANAAAFCGLWVALGASGQWQRWLAIYCGLSFAASGFGYLVAQLTSPANASMLISISMLGFAVFNGINPALKSVAALPVVNWFWYLSFANYVAEAVYFTYTAFEAPVRSVSKASMQEFGFESSESAFFTTIGAMFGIGFFWRTGALIALWAKTR